MRVWFFLIACRIFFLLLRGGGQRPGERSKWHYVFAANLWLNVDETVDVCLIRTVFCERVPVFFCYRLLRAETRQAFQGVDNHSQCGCTLVRGRRSVILRGAREGLKKTKSASGLRLIFLLFPVPLRSFEVAVSTRLSGIA